MATTRRSKPAAATPAPAPAKAVAAKPVTAKATTKAAAARLQPATTQAAVDAISLAQALLDVEAANARVIDLTRRLTAMNQEIIELRQQLARGPAGRVSDHGAARDLFEARAEIAALRLQYCQ